MIFDFNGTLCDDEPILLEIFTELFDEHLGWELTPEDYYGRLAGRSDREIVEIVVAEQAAGDAALTEDLLRLRGVRYQQEVAGRSPIAPRTVALVDRLAAEGVPMAIVTGAQREDVRCVLDSSPVGRHLSHLVTEEDVRNGKPDPEGFLAGAEALGLRPAQLLVFEDSLPGVRGARAAGMSCIAVGGARASAELRAVAEAVVPALDVTLLDHAP